jgi:hypothetical protein
MARPVRRWLLAAVSAAAVAACTPDADMPATAEMPDTAEVRRAIEETGARDSMLDTLPGGEMARGDSAAARRLLQDKMPWAPADSAVGAPADSDP